MEGKGTCKERDVERGDRSDARREIERRGEERSGHNLTTVSFTV